VAKALAATNSSIDTFVQLIGDSARTVQAVPLLGFAQAAAGGYFDESGFPAGKGWDEVALPSANDEHAYALEISGDQMRPAYRDGDIIVVSPGTPIRRGDRVVVKTRGGEVMVKELKRRTAKTLELQSLNPNHVDRTLAAADVEWIARIVWASQ
jgi:phage repressor protein C with HTH and peptisase S24 domain